MSQADQYFCEVCAGGENDELMLLCDGCDDAYHTYCLTPPMASIPPGDWRCPRCVNEVIKSLFSISDMKHLYQTFILLKFNKLFGLLDMRL